MTRSRFTLARQIDELARLTLAPAALVEEIRAIFARRGIGLDEDALPYAEILDETFARAAEIERDGAEARAAFRTLEENSCRFADACQELYGHLRGMEDFLRGTPRPTPAEAAKRRRQARDRAAARRAAAAKSGRPFFVILTPSDPE
jgi:hypothetical protein